MRLIDAIFSGATVGETADAMAEISEDMAEQYLAAMEEQVNALNAIAVDGSRSVSGNAVSIRNIRIAFYDEQPNNTQARGIYGNDLEGGYRWMVSRILRGYNGGRNRLFIGGYCG